MAVTQVTIANKALALVGSNTISTFVGTSTEQIVATELYDMIVEAALVSHRWRFATGKQTLSRLVDVPLDQWDAAYQLPTQPILLLLNGVYVLDVAIDYDRYEDKVFCDAAVDDTVNADYIFRANEADWPAYFTSAVVADLAGNFAAGITQDASMSTLFSEKSEILYRKARWADSSSQTAKNLDARTLIRKRGRI
tara:strand:+ start:17044 stop:17628 length:585 start_codon:yes stop_codon:yes gene_type:complete